MCGGAPSYIKIVLSALLQCWNELVAQKIFVPLTVQVTRPEGSISSKKKGPTINAAVNPHHTVTFLRMKRQCLHLERILSCSYSAILSIDRILEMEMGSVCPQNVSSRCIVHFHSSKKLQGESFSFWPVSSNQLLNMRNFEWIALQDVS
ncbi:hypothetical protein AVEN_211371-1 [Araneus ventricosus]|uniref:Uncharacterized protein n=1 Tax=Araneus ventricosus TaxID=182803 RepID=A0A4Y2RMM0_ARAVE|nr:hypothetical protein AVEN_211371-1 [Araneus ventricosus]